MRHDPLIGDHGGPLAYGAKVQLTLSEALAVPHEVWNDFLYKRKLVLVKGMRKLSQNDFWLLCTHIGGRAWEYADYEVSGENRTYIDEAKTRAITVYDNIFYKKALSDGEMSWHVDVPLWASHAHPVRCFYATSIPDNRHGQTIFADRAYPVPRLTPEEREELERWSLLYHSWYKPYTELTYLPAIGKHPYTQEEYLAITSFNNSLAEYSHDKYGWKVPGWIIGAMRDGVPHNADIVSKLHKQVLVPENTYTHYWDEEDFLIYSNVNMIHARTKLNSHLNPTKPRSFYRMNVFNRWQ